MAATTPPRSESLRRFTRGERWLHLSFAALMGVLILTAAFLYVDPLSAMVGRRALLAEIHFWAGLLLPIPLVVAVLVSPAFRQDARRLNRFQPWDWTWLRRALRLDTSGPSGKFNAGQKVNSAFVLGATIVMVVTGLMLHFFEPLPDTLRTGATFAHDMFALAIVVMGVGHIWMAWNDPEARSGLRTGFVSPGWAAHKHPLWQETREVPPSLHQDP